MSHKGLFITFEGGEGSGKTTLMDRLAKKLEKEGFHILVTREPGGTVLGEEIRKLLLNIKYKECIGDLAELFLFLSARAQHVESIIMPALLQNKVVLCDRFNDSTIVYQGIGRGLGLDKVTKLCKYACMGCNPHLTFLLDVSPDIGLKRLSFVDTAGLNEADRIESEKLCFHENVRQGFLSLAKAESNRFCVLDASLTEESIFNKAYEIFKKVNI